MNWGMAEEEAREHREYRLKKDLEAGHDPGCGISVPNPGVCTCGLFEPRCLLCKQTVDEGPGLVREGRVTIRCTDLFHPEVRYAQKSGESNRWEMPLGFVVGFFFAFILFH